MQFARAMTGQTLTDKSLNNLFSVFAPFEVQQIAKLGVSGAKAFQLRQTMKAMTKAATGFSEQPAE